MYTGGGKRLPIQWSAWLAHTRPHPPTIEELQADVARQQRVLANVALIEARDRAEEQERMKLRQEDAHLALQKALADVSSSARIQNDFIDNTNPTTSNLYEEQKLGLGEVASAVSNTGQANGRKIRPPTFLTPAKSPKFQTTTPISSSLFTASPDVSKTLTQGAFAREHQCQQKKADRIESLDAAYSTGSDSQMQLTDGTSPVKSRVAETESWTPKARARR